MAMQWKDGDTSTVGIQLRKFHFQKTALIEAVKEQYFQPLSSAVDMPKHYGKTIKKYHFLPLLDDRNVNDQGIDAAGSVVADGNLYGSSKDIGTVTGKLPTLSETGGRVNRVGYSRIALEASLSNMGFFHEFTDESMNFDTMDDLYEHISRELIRGASEMTEDVLQIDLLNGAGTTRFGGDATTLATCTAEGATPSVIDYDDLVRMGIDLDNNRTPKQTKILTGSRLVDTKVINNARFLYVGSELIPMLTEMTDSFGNPAFVPVEQYAYGGDYKQGNNGIHGEIGKVGPFRIVVVPEMLSWQGEGATVTTNPGFHSTTKGGADKYDVFPMLCVGDGSFVTVGFQTGGKSFKFKIITKMPGEKTADRNDPYGRTGFSSIQWYYGTMILRPERLALAHTVAKL